MNDTCPGCGQKDGWHLYGCRYPLEQTNATLRSENADLQMQLAEAKAEIAKWENESAAENTCKKHPNTPMFYGCKACMDKFTAEAKDEIEKLSVERDALTRIRLSRILIFLREPQSGESLAKAWNFYVRFFGEPPHGTEQQLSALLAMVQPYGDGKESEKAK